MTLPHSLLTDRAFAEEPGAEALILAMSRVPAHHPDAGSLAPAFELSWIRVQPAWLERPAIVDLLADRLRIQLADPKEASEALEVMGEVLDHFRGRKDGAERVAAIAELCSAHASCWDLLEKQLFSVPEWVRQEGFPEILRRVLRSADRPSLHRLQLLVDRFVHVAPAGSEIHALAAAWLGHPGLRELVQDQPFSFDALREGLEERRIQNAAKSRMSEAVRASRGDPQCLQQALLALLK